MTGELTEAAKFERDRRATRYPALVAQGKLGADEAQLDYQCWHAIADWLETDRFTPIDFGGIDGETVVGWALCDAAVARALTRLTAKCDNLEQQASAHPERAPSLVEVRCRRSHLAAIHRKLQLRRQLIEEINAEYRASGGRAERKHEFRARRAHAATVGLDGPRTKDAA